MDDEEDEVLARFLSQPAEHGVGDEEPVNDSNAVVTRPSWRARLRHFLFEKEPSEYSTIMPKKADGTFTRIFPFNGNGKR